MIANYCGLRHMPFTADLPVPHLFPSDAFGEVVARLRYLMDARGLGLLTGEAGAGKSTALQALAAQCDPATHPLIYLADSHQEPAGFYRDVLEQCGVQPARTRLEVRLQFQRLFVDWHRHQGKTPLICIDEARLLSALMVQEIRFATNFGRSAPRLAVRHGADRPARTPQPAAAEVPGGGGPARHGALPPVAPGRGAHRPLPPAPVTRRWR